MTSEPTNNFEKRLQRIEDQLAIYQIIGAYGAAADSNNIEMMYTLYHKDCELIIAGHGTYKGHKGVTDVIMGDYHQMLITSGSGHTTSFPNVQIDGDRAIATVYSMLFLLRDEKFILERLAAARWEFIRTADGWKIIKRTTEPMLGTNQNAKDLLRRVLKIA